MPRKKKPAGQRITFRISQEKYDLLARIADARGLDLSSVVNSVLAESEPELRRWLAGYERAMNGAVRAQ